MLAGQCLLLIDGEERPLRAWDFVHCPAWTELVFIGAGDGPCAVLAVGTRFKDDVIYPAIAFAQRHNAAAPHTMRDPEEAYASLPPDAEVPYRDGWLPG